MRFVLTLAKQLRALLFESFATPVKVKGKKKNQHLWGNDEMVAIVTSKVADFTIMGVRIPLSPPNILFFQNFAWKRSFWGASLPTVPFKSLINRCFKRDKRIVEQRSEKKKFV